MFPLHDDAFRRLFRIFALGNGVPAALVLLLGRAGLVDGRRAGDVDDEHHALVEHGLRRRFDLKVLSVAAKQRKDAAVVVFQATLVDDDVVHESCIVRHVAMDVNRYPFVDEGMASTNCDCNSASV